MRVLLIGNYPPDQQRSMLRFADILAESLQAIGVTVQHFEPPVVLGKWACPTRGFGKIFGYIDKYFFALISLRNRLKKIPNDTVVHICDHSNSHYTSVTRKFPCVITCHDLIAVHSALGRYPDNCPKWSGRIQQKIIAHYLKKSRAIVSISEQTNRYAKELCPTPNTRHYVSLNALDPAFSKIASADNNHRTEEKGTPYVLLVGSAAWYKNRPAALSIFSRMLKEMPELELKIVGPAFSDDELGQFLYLEGKIQCYQGLTDAELIELYGSAQLLIFPSIIEGFGWPIVEAQACGCPVFTLNREPMSKLNASPHLISRADPEEPNWIDTAATQCLDALGKPASEREALRQTLKIFAAQFDLTRMAEEHLRIYKTELQEQR